MLITNKLQRTRKYAQEGLSVIEVLVILAALAIIVLLSYPSYQQYILKTQRNDAYTALSEAAQDIERHYAQNQSYQGYTLPSNISPEGLYVLSLNNTAATYTIFATARGQQTADVFQSFSVDHTNARRHTLNDGTSGNGWD